MKNQMFEIVQQAKYITEEDIENGIKNGFKCIQKYAYILHDKDINEDGNPKAPHYHIYLRFNYSVDSKTVAEWFNIKEQYINKIKGRFYDACLYANHANAPDKYQYSINDIIANFDIAAEQKKKVKVMSKQDELTFIENIIDRIGAGEIRKYNLTKYIDIKLYTKYASRINKAFDYFHNDWSLHNRNNKIQVWFFTGASGSGKTTYAQAIAESLIATGDYNGVCISGASNDPLQDYGGQDILILDDLRDNAFKYQDIIKFLDNNTRSAAAARYSNKTFYGKLIFITSYEPLQNWYKGIKEDKKQLYRRITKYFECINDEIAEYNIKNGKLAAKEFVRSFKNPIGDLVKQLEENGQDDEINFDITNVIFFIAKAIGEQLTDEQVNLLISTIKTEEQIELPF